MSHKSRWRHGKNEIDYNERQARAYRALVKNPPCKVCEMRRSEHVNDKCLFNPGDFVQPTRMSIKIFLRWGTYKHEGRRLQG